MSNKKQITVRVRSCFKENVPPEIEDALWLELFEILGVFDHHAGDHFSVNESKEEYRELMGNMKASPPKKANNGTSIS